GAGGQRPAGGAAGVAQRAAQRRVAGPGRGRGGVAPPAGPGGAGAVHGPPGGAGPPPAGGPGGGPCRRGGGGGGPRGAGRGGGRGWLAGGPADPTPEADLAALGEVAAGWAAIVPRRKGAKPPKPLPGPLQQVLARLRPDAADRYPSAAALLEDLERAGAGLPD